MERHVKGCHGTNHFRKKTNARKWGTPIVSTNYLFFSLEILFMICTGALFCHTRKQSKPHRGSGRERASWGTSLPVQRKIYEKQFKKSSEKRTEYISKYTLIWINKYAYKGNTWYYMHTCINYNTLKSITDQESPWHPRWGISREPLRKYYLESECIVFNKYI